MPTPRILILCDPQNDTWLTALNLDSASTVLSDASKSRQQVIRDCEQRGGSYEALLIPAHLRYLECPLAVDCGGVELLKYLRFLPLSAGSSQGASWLTRVPIISVLSYSAAYYARRAADNSILFSPGCATLCGTFGSQLLRDTLDSLLPGVKRTTMRAQLRPYAVATTGQEDEQEHSFRNKAGVLKLFKEFAGHVIDKDDPFLKILQTVENELWLCKLRYKNAFESEKCSLIDETFVRRCCDAKMVYVDDQHREGWSYGLYAGLFLDKTDVKKLNKARERLRDVTKSTISLHQKRFTCIDNALTSQAYFSKQAQDFDESLEDWAQADASAQNGNFDAQEARRQAEERLKAAAQMDVVFLDMRLTKDDERSKPEDSSGVRQLEFIKSKFPYVSVIMLTASRKAHSVQASKQASEFWVKAESSGEDLRNAIDQALDMNLIRDLWLRVRQVEARRCVPLYVFDTSSFELLTISDEADRIKSEIVQLLKVSLNLMQSALETRNELDKDNYFRLITLNMGIIQESRLQGYDMGKNYAPAIMRFEQGLRDLRNKIGAHSDSNLEFECKPPIFMNISRRDWTVDNKGLNTLRQFIGDPNDTTAKVPNLLQAAVTGLLVFTLNKLLSDF